MSVAYQYFDVILTIAVVGIWVLIFRVVYAVREGIAWTLRAILRGVLAYLAVLTVLTMFGSQTQQRYGASIVIAGIAVACTKPRSRYIRASVRRKVIARDLKGEKYDSRKHHIDHIWPHSRGGSNTADNLRAIDKKRNLQKGAKKPKLSDWF